MKAKIVFIVMLLLSMLCSPSVSAQNLKQMKKDQKVLMKQVKKEARKQARTLKKDGWKVAVGGAPIKTQLQELFLRERGGSSVGMKQYIVGKSEAVSASYAEARELAIARAKNEIAGSVRTKVAELLESSMANVQTDGLDAKTVQKDESRTKQLIDQSLDDTEVVMELYRTINDNTQFQIGVAYENSLAKTILRQMLEQK